MTLSYLHSLNAMLRIMTEQENALRCIPRLVDVSDMGQRECIGRRSD